MRTIIGTEAVSSGVLTRGQLRANFTAVHPNVYLANGQSQSILTRAEAAWLWTGRTGIIGGRAAAFEYGVRFIDESIPIDIFAKHGRKRAGIVIHEEQLADDEVFDFGEMPMTTPERTALDLARWLPRNAAVILLDRLAAITEIDASVVEALERRHRGARGIQQARRALYLMDGGTRSPEETRLRLQLADAGLPKPRTSIWINDGTSETVIGMGWERPKVGVSFYAGDGGDRMLAMWDLNHQEVVQRCGWMELRAIALNQPRSMVHRVERALRDRAR